MRSGLFEIALAPNGAPNVALSETAVLAHELDELGGRLAARVVEPAAAIDDVVLLEHAQPRADRRRVREDEDLPALLGRVRRDDVLKPLQPSSQPDNGTLSVWTRWIPSIWTHMGA